MIHNKDEDCEGFIVDGCCTICSVGNGECSSCNGIRYHEKYCPESDATWETLEKILDKFEKYEFTKLIEMIRYRENKCIS
jgi:hypothetical protein